MQYLGGKSRISNQISEIINKHSKDKDFVSLFCGTCSIESKVISKSKTLNDSHSYLIEMFKDLQNGREFPQDITEIEYKEIKFNIDKDKGLSGFVGFGCSFGGKWWGGYARQTKGLNYALTAKNSLNKKMVGLTSANFFNDDYKNIEIKDGSVVYCDPPYENTTSYSNSSKFSSSDFWEYVRKISMKNIVFISEINCPDDFISIWQKDFTRNLEANKIIKSVEHLYKYKFGL